MELNEFTRTIATAFEDSDTITPQTDYRNHQEWCSIVALTVMSVVRKRYRVTLRAEDIRSCGTIEDLFNLVANKE